jgi:hypothetical protein
VKGEPSSHSATAFHAPAPGAAIVAWVNSAPGPLVAGALAYGPTMTWPAALPASR